MNLINKCLLAIFLVAAGLSAQDIQILDLQYHYDFRREHPTVTQEFFATDKLGYTYFFMDINFDHTLHPGGLSDVYFEFMRYFTVAHLTGHPVYLTIQYDDGSKPINQSWLAGFNLGDINAGPLNFSGEFLLRKEYRLGLTWQYTMVWMAKFLNEKLVFNGYFDFWNNDVDNADWPDIPEFRKTRYSFQTEPQIGWQFTSHLKVGSEIEISRGFLGAVTGALVLHQDYQHNKWYVLPTLFVQYTF